MQGFKVDIKSICTEQYDDGEEYGEWSSSHSNTFNGITRDDEYPDITTTLTIEDGELVFVVWYEYSSGNSFGRGFCNCVDPMGIFKSREAAEELAKAIRIFDKDTDLQERYSFSCTTSDGQEFHVGWAPWVGFFENLENVYVETTSVGDSKSRRVF